ncbi:MAG: hypothetical protein PHR35_05910 [Kiritimatiellae bacterium]|nr:hypothetical protein [Kiritimatiellia bacterium]
MSWTFDTFRQWTTRHGQRVVLTIVAGVAIGSTYWWERAAPRYWAAQDELLLLGAYLERETALDRDAVQMWTSDDQYRATNAAGQTYYQTYTNLVGFYPSQYRFGAPAVQLATLSRAIYESLISAGDSTAWYAWCFLDADAANICNELSDIEEIEDYFINAAWYAANVVASGYALPYQTNAPVYITTNAFADHARVLSRLHTTCLINRSVYNHALYFDNSPSSMVWRLDIVATNATWEDALSDALSDYSTMSPTLMWSEEYNEIGSATDFMTCEVRPQLGYARIIETHTVSRMVAGGICTNFAGTAYFLYEPHIRGEHYWHPGGAVEGVPAVFGAPVDVGAGSQSGYLQSEPWDRHSTRVPAPPGPGDDYWTNNWFFSRGWKSNAGSDESACVVRWEFPSLMNVSRWWGEETAQRVGMP